MEHLEHADMLQGVKIEECFFKNEILYSAEEIQQVQAVLSALIQNPAVQQQQRTDRATFQLPFIDGDL